MKDSKKDPKDVFKKYCSKHGMRYTPEREIIIDEIYCKDGHFDIDELFLRIRRKHPNIKLAKGSIYRTIPHLIRAGLIRESLAEDAHISYEHTMGHQHHDHMKCIGCGKIFEFYEEGIDRIQQELCRRRNFKMMRHTHVIDGYCRKCQEEKKKR